MAITTRIFVFFTTVLLIPAGVSFSQVVPATKPDSTAKKPAVSNSGIKSKIDYSSTDSMRFDVSNQKVFLYGEAKVEYEDMELKANYIEFDMKNNIAYARGARDSSGKVLVDSSKSAIGDPVFSDAGKSFVSKEIHYNFRTKKGKIKEVVTQEGEAFIHAKDAKKDTSDVYYVKNGKYTTCDLEHPHFYINATKLKIIQDDKIIAGPAYLAVGDVPTPLIVPFGVFPNKQGRKSGVLIPTYGESELGFFLKDGGYYFGISDYIDLALRGDIYSKQSFAIKANTNYTKRYRYNGALGLNFARLKIGQKEFPDYSTSKDFFVRWRHMQDPKTSPTFQFSANVNAGSSTYQTYNSNTTNDYLANTFQSNVSLVKTWPGKPYNFSMNMSHNQNTINRTVSVVLPEAAFTAGRLYPFKKRNAIGRQNALRKIGLSPAIYAKNQISTIDTLLLKPNAIDKFQNGFKTTMPVSTSMNLGPFIITPSAGVTGYGYFQTIHKRWAADTSPTFEVYTDTILRFTTAYEYNAAVSVGTKIFGMFSFKNAKVKAIRHVMTPSASLSFRPDFSRPEYGYYYYVQTNTIGDSVQYSIFQNGIYGTPAPGKSVYVNFSVSNNLEMKLRPAKKDTAGLDRKIMLIENFSISGGYNLAAEHYQWSNYFLSARTKLFKVVDITLSGVIDPYMYDTVLKRRIEKLMINQANKIGRLTSAMMAVGASVRSLDKNLRKKAVAVPNASGVKKNSFYEDQLNYIMMHPDYYVDFNIPWDLTFFYNIIYSKPEVRDTFIQTFTFSGNLNVTEKWKVGFHSGLDFVKKNFTYTSFDIYRDLHCWEMHLNWIPFGFRKSYMLTIAVKASVLQDMKLSRKRDWYDNN